jgi:hypothetical protein
VGAGGGTRVRQLHIVPDGLLVLTRLFFHVP